MLKFNHWLALGSFILFFPSIIFWYPLVARPSTAVLPALEPSFFYSHHVGIPQSRDEKGYTFPIFPSRRDLLFSFRFLRYSTNSRCALPTASVLFLRSWLRPNYKRRYGGVGRRWTLDKLRHKKCPSAGACSVRIGWRGQIFGNRFSLRKKKSSSFGANLRWREDNAGGFTTNPFKERCVGRFNRTSRLGEWAKALVTGLKTWTAQKKSAEVL